MIVLVEIDKSGSDFFEKGYSIAVVKDKKEVYGYKVSQELTDRLLHLFKNDGLGIDTRKFSKNKQRVRVKVRAHSACIILIIKEIIKDFGGFENIVINLCNDIDGHFDDIRHMIYSNLKYDIPSLDPKEHITPAQFSKSSLVNIAAKNIREGNKEVSTYNIVKLSIEDLIKLIKKVR